MRKSSRGKWIERYIDRKSQREEKGGDVKACDRCLGGDGGGD